MTDKRVRVNVTRPRSSHIAKSLYASIDTPDAGESGMEMVSGNPPADIDICVVPDVLPTAIYVRTVVSDKLMEIDTPDAVMSSMEVAGGSPPAVSNISVNTDVLQTAIYVTTQVSEKWMMIGSPDAVDSGCWGVRNGNGQWKSSGRYRHLRGSGCAADSDICEDSSVR